jgi:GTPase SAR1 family protein
MDASASSSSAPENVSKKQPSVIITIGMAGAGKSTFVQRLNSHLHAKNTPPYIMNLDPAITHSPFEANIDIRDTVDYKQVMKQCVFFAIDRPFYMVLKSGTGTILDLMEEF